jgi:acyl dehydratase
MPIRPFAHSLTRPFAHSPTRPLAHSLTRPLADRKPLHFDAEAAGRSIFGGLIVQGGITSGLLNAIVAEDLPGPGTVFLSVEWKFVKPVYVGDSITGRVEIATVRDDKPVCTIATSARNQDGVVCLSGTATTYTVALKISERQ